MSRKKAPIVDNSEEKAKTVSNREKCEHEAYSLDDMIVIPFETGDVRDLDSLFSYFLYRTPGLDSIHADGRLTGETPEKAVAGMCNKASMIMEHSFVLESTVLKDDEPHTFEKRNRQLKGDSICMVCSRMLCGKREVKRNNDKYVEGGTEPKKLKLEESAYQSLIRHIRNSIAHGLVYATILESEYYLLFIDKEKTGKKDTARIVISKKQLEDWKAILEGIIE